MPFRLKNIVLKEISFVNKGASGDDSHKPKIVFLKGQSVMKKKLTMRERLAGLFAKEEQPRTPEQMYQEIKDSLPPEKQDVLDLLLQAAAASPSPAPAEPNPEPAPEKKLDDEMEDKELEKVLKGNPALKEHLEKIHAARKADREEIAALQKQHKEDLKKRRRSEFKKQLEEFTWLPGDHNDVARLLDNVELKLDERDQESLTSLFRVTNGLVRKATKSSKFVETGSSRPDDDDGDAGAAYEKLQAMAVELAKKDGITVAKARALVLKENKELRSTINKAASQGVTLGR